MATATATIAQLQAADPTADGDLLPISQAVDSGHRTKSKTVAGLRTEAFTAAKLPAAVQGALITATVGAQIGELDGRATVAETTLDQMTDSGDITGQRTRTQDEYDAILSKKAGTIYYVTG